MKIGFIGLGVMGGPMAANIVKAGHQLTVYDRSPQAVEALVKLGARSASALPATSSSPCCPSHSTWSRWSSDLMVS